jgi:predicted porin
MIMKKSVIIAGAVAAIMAGTAVADTTVYGRARMGLIIADGNDNVGLVNDSSRFGFKGSEDLGNGMSAIYHFELGYTADEKTSSAVQNRIGVVGLKGDFGTFAMGNMWVPVYNLVQGTLDPFNHFGLDDGYQLGARAGDALAYVNKFGSVDFQFAIVADEADTNDLMDAYNVAVKIPAGPVNIAVGIHSNTDDSGTAIVVSYKGDGFTVAGGLNDAEDLGGDKVTTLLGTFNVGSGKILARFSSLDAADVTGTTIGYHHNLSKRTQAYIENSSADFADQTIIGLKHNF